MKKPKWPLRVVVKYVLLQLPGTIILVLLLILIRSWINFPQWLFWVILTVWVGKDILLFPLVWRAYDSNTSQKKHHPMIGLHAVTESRLSPAGYVKVRGELWRAVAAEKNVSIERGTTVKIHDIKGLTLTVEPEGSE